MTWLETTQSILTILGASISIVGVPTAIFIYYTKDRQKDGDKVAHLKEMEVLLGTKFEIFKNLMESEMKSLATIMTSKMEGVNETLVDIKKNHLHSMYEKQRDQDSQIGKLTVEMTNRMTALETKIDERIPKKQT